VTTALFIVMGYLFGSMPWGYWLVRVFKGVDIRSLGSGNVGGTNVWRVYGRWMGIPVVLLDTAKGFVPALLAAIYAGHGTAVLAGAAAMLGHYRPLFLGWKRGGKMVATCGGAFLGLAPLVGGVALGVWILTFLLLRYASVASLVAAATMPVAAWALGYPWPVIVFAAVAATAVAFLHRENVKRLVRGQENRFQLRGRRSPKLPSGSATR
jgi:glycerol-3-phosphate acyltransferase PlsY